MPYRLKQTQYAIRHMRKRQIRRSFHDFIGPRQHASTPPCTPPSDRHNYLFLQLIGECKPVIHGNFHHRKKSFQ